MTFSGELEEENVFIFLFKKEEEISLRAVYISKLEKNTSKPTKCL